jgi:hypothetical protein
VIGVEDGPEDSGRVEARAAVPADRRVGADERGGQRGDAVAFAQPRAARTELLDHADELVAGSEQWLRHPKIGACPQLGIGERHPRGQYPDTHLARAGLGVVVLHHRQLLGSAEPVDDDTLHALNVGVPRPLHRVFRFVQAEEFDPMSEPISGCLLLIARSPSALLIVTSTAHGYTLLILVDLGM